MNEKGKDLIFFDKPYIYAFGRPSWSIAHGHGVCTQSVTENMDILILKFGSSPV